MAEILNWSPLLWTARVLLLILLGGGTLVSILYLARFLRPRHIKRLLTADLPTFRTFGGAADVLGQRIELNATLDTERDAQLGALHERIKELEGVIRDLAPLLAPSLSLEGSDEEQAQDLEP